MLSLYPVHKGIANCICKSKKIRHPAARENILKRHKSVEQNLNLNFGLHSVQSGGASATVRSDVNERCIKIHGKWKSDVSKDGYIADTFARRDCQYLKALEYNFSKLSALSLYFVLKLSWKFGKYAYLFASLFLNSYELRDRPFNLKGGGVTVFCFVQNFFFGQHKS